MRNLLAAFLALALVSPAAAQTANTSSTLTDFQVSVTVFGGNNYV